MDAEGALFETSANTFFDIKNFGALGRIQLNNRGLNCFRCKSSWNLRCWCCGCRNFYQYRRLNHQS
jgi:hypothetical protein